MVRKLLIVFVDDFLCVFQVVFGFPSAFRNLKPFPEDKEFKFALPMTGV